MKRNITITILIVALVVLGFYFYDQNNKRAVAPEEELGGAASQEESAGQQAPQASRPTSEADQATSAPAAVQPVQSAQAPKQSQGTWSSGREAEGMAPDILVVEISYDGSAYSPSTVNIKAGDVVVFRNKSSENFWPASGPHPSHSNYPDFDPKKAVAAGGKWQFMFENVGNWVFHDHLNPSARGVVNVSAR